MATVVLTPASFDSDHSYYSANSTSSPIGQGSTGGSYATIYLTRGSRAVTYASWSFDTSDIPSGATIKSVSCSAKCYTNGINSSYVSTRQIQLYSGSTAKGSAYTVSNSINSFTMSAGTWTRAELNNARIRVYAVRGTSSTNSNYYFRFYGASLTIEYSLANHTVTITKNGFDVTPDSGTYEEGTIIPITINGSVPKVTLDGNDISDQFVKSALSNSYSGAPSGYSSTGISSGSNAAGNAVGKTAENPYNGTTNWYGSSSAAVDSQYVQYTFDVSSIPTDATNIKISCKVAGAAESNQYSHQSGGRYSVWGLYYNGTLKGSQAYTTSTSNTVIEITDTGSWSRNELNGLQLRHCVGYYGGHTNGVTLTITYSLPNSGDIYVYNLTVSSDHVIVFSSAGEECKLYVKQNNKFTQVTKAYRKVNNVWVEVTDLKSLFEGAENGTWSGYNI